MRLSTLIPVALYLAVSTQANPMPKKGHKGHANNNNTVAAAPPPPPANVGAAAGGAVDVNVQSAVATTIGQWLNDIAAVNLFLDTAGSLKSNAEISAAAATAFIAAQGEGQSNTLLNQTGLLDATGLAAATKLVSQFGIIGPAINDTITNPQNLQKNLAAINGARCPPTQGDDAINNEGAVQQSAAKAVGIQAPTPPFPAACTNVPATQRLGTIPGHAAFVIV